MSDRPVRLNFHRQWQNFTVRIVRYEMDLWLFNNNHDMFHSVNRVMSNLPELLLWHEILVFHEKSQANELTDEWLFQSQLGQTLRLVNVRILAVVERAIIGEVDGEHVRCSLLLGPL